MIDHSIHKSLVKIQWFVTPGLLKGENSKIIVRILPCIGPVSHWQIVRCWTRHVYTIRIRDTQLRCETSSHLKTSMTWLPSWILISLLPTSLVPIHPRIIHRHATFCFGSLYVEALLFFIRLFGSSYASRGWILFGACYICSLPRVGPPKTCRCSRVIYILALKLSCLSWASYLRSHELIRLQ